MPKRKHDDPFGFVGRRLPSNSLRSLLSSSGSEDDASAPSDGEDDAAAPSDGEEVSDETESHSQDSIGDDNYDSDDSFMQGQHSIDSSDNNSISDNDTSSEGHSVGRDLWSGISDNALLFSLKCTEMGIANEKQEELFLAATNGTMESEYSKELKTVDDLIHETFKIDTQILCGTCHSSKAYNGARCVNVNCERRLRADLRSNPGLDIEIVSCDLGPYFRMQIGKVIEIIIEQHGQLHNGNTHLDDISTTPFVQQAIETREDYNAGRIILPLMWNTDGGKVKGNSRGSLWPLLLVILTLPRSMRQNLNQMCFPACLLVGSTPSAAVINCICMRISHFVESTVVHPILLTREDGSEVSVTLKIVAGAMDCAAVKSVYRFGAWQNSEGCYKCDVVAQPMVGRRGLSWPVNGNYTLRRNEGAHFNVLDDASMGVHGFAGPSAAMEMCAINLLMIDVLHIYSEGIVCNIFEGITGVGRFDVVKFSRAGVVYLKEVQNGLLPFSGLSVKPVALERYTTITGTEKDASLVHVVGSALFVQGCLVNPNSAAILLFLALFVRLCTGEELTAGMVASMQDCARKFFSLLTAFNVDPTYKTHLLVHMFEELNHTGNPWSFSTHATESAFQPMRRLLTQKNTRGVTQQVFYRVLKTCALRGECHSRGLLDRKKDHVYPDCDVFMPVVPNKNADVDANAWSFSRAMPRIYKTFQKVSIGGVKFVSALTSRSTESQRYGFLVQDIHTGQPFVAYFLLAGKCDNGATFLYVERFPTENPIERVYSELYISATARGEVRTPLWRETAALLRHLVLLNKIYFEFLESSSSFEIIRPEQVVAPLSLVRTPRLQIAINASQKHHHT